MVSKASRLYKDHHGLERPPFECIALLLQGGGALGAYQAGVYKALNEAAIEPDWVAGISIGAINAAIIVGNAPEDRVQKLDQFWHLISDRSFLTPYREYFRAATQGDQARTWFNEMSAGLALLNGAEGFFTPRFPAPFFEPAGSLAATSFYDTDPLKKTLEGLIDFDRINNDGKRLSLGTVNVRTGNFTYFDTETHTIGPEHVMASGALPPGFPAVEIEGEFYWDGGLVSNTPLQWVLRDSGTRQDTLAFQVDLWSAKGEFPKNLADVSERQKEIQFSSRTRHCTNEFSREHELQADIAKLLARLPADLAESEEAKRLKESMDHHVYNIVHLIYRSKHYEGSSRDYEFSRLSVEDHWHSGYIDAVHSLRHPEIFERPDNVSCVNTFDYLSETT
ncbi:patatin-like phospholipase family protein [Hoeflea sp. CAU 1731]